MMKKTAAVSDVVKSIARQTNSFIDSSRGSKKTLDPSEIPNFSYEALADGVIAGVDENMEYNVGDSGRPRPSQDYLFEGIRDFEGSYDSLSKVLSKSETLQIRNIGHTIENIIKMSGSLLPLYDDIIVNQSRRDPDLAQIRNRSNANGVSGKLDILSSSICSAKLKLVNYVESVHGLEWRGMDDSWFVVSRVGFELNHYANSIRQYFESLVRMDDLDQYADNSDLSLMKILVHNANILEVMSNFKTINNIVGSCMSSVSESISSVSEPIDFSSEEGGAKVLKIKIQRTGTTGGREQVEDGNTDILIKNQNKANIIEIKITGASKNQILSQITDRVGASQGKQIFLHSRLGRIGSSSVVVKDGSIVINLTASKKVALSSATIIAIRDLDNSIVSRDKFELRADGEDTVTKDCSFAIKQEDPDSGSPASDGVFASSKDEINKVGEATTQSTYYEINYKGKKITTTISEFIKNNGYYNVDGKKVKLRLSDAKPKGISNAKKRS